MSQETYDVEQERLRAEYEGKSDVSITLPQEPEVDPKVYVNVEPLLYRGFLILPASVNHVRIVFKSINHHEMEFLKMSGAMEDKEGLNTFLAFGVFMINGVNILPDRDRWLSKIEDMFASIPQNSRMDILRHLSEVNRRASSAVSLTEAYAMEKMSRYRWLQLKGLDLTSTAVTGVEGSSRLGLNWAQQLWRAINLVEDRREDAEREWENSKFIGSCFAGKGISKVYSQDTERRRKEREERMTRKDQILREIVLGEKIESDTQVLPGMVVKTPRTVEELASQLERDLRGEKDWHDEVVAAHEGRIRDNLRQRQDQQREMALENEKSFGGHYVVGGVEKVLTPAEMEEHVAHRKQIMAQNAARAQVRPDMDERTQGYLEKWNGPEVRVSTTDRDPSGAIDLPKPRAPQTPFKGVKRG